MNRRLLTARYPNVFFFGLVLFLLASGCNIAPEAPKTDTLKTGPVFKGKIHVVRIEQMVFKPSIVKVKKGDKVVFDNQDMVPHDVTEEKSKKWFSGPLDPGKSWNLIVTESADYYCTIHQVMKGQIIVE